MRSFRALCASVQASWYVCRVSIEVYMMLIPGQLVSALSKMLISSMKSLQESGFNSQQSGLIAYSCLFLGGCGIRLLTGLIHRLMPSKSVDCEHTHEDEPQHDHAEPQHKSHSETTPLLQHSKSNGNGAARHDSSDEMQERQKKAGGRPSLQSRISSTVSMLRKGPKHACDANGPCYGYSDPCGDECFKNINQRGGRNGRLSPWNGIKRPTATLRHSTAGILSASIKPLRSIDEEANMGVPRAPLTGKDSRRKNSDTAVPSTTISEQPELHTAETDTQLSQSTTQGSHASHDSHEHDDHERSGQGGAHHHHIPTNKFLSIGLQTSIAIALWVSHCYVKIFNEANIGPAINSQRASSHTPLITPTPSWDSRSFSHSQFTTSQRASR